LSAAFFVSTIECGQNGVRRFPFSDHTVRASVTNNKPRRRRAP
jgi:hypothetical protein